MRPHSSDGDARRSSASSRMRASSRSRGSTARWPSPTVRPRSRCVISSRDGWPESAVSSSRGGISSARRPRVSRKATRAASSRSGRCPTDISDESLLLVPLFRRGKREIVEHFDVIVVGAGPAGSAAALTLARKGFSTLLVERGRSPGAKGMFGGRIYAWPFAELLPEWAKDCPIERRVVRENLAFLTDDASLGISFDAPKMAQGRGASFTALRAKFDAWFAKKAQDAGAASLGLRGGGFLYTNRASVSLGLVVSSEDLSRKKVEIQEVQTKFRMHPAVQRLIRGGKVVEYSAHLVPELGAGMMPRLSGDGVLVVGDAAGFLINNGYTFRGVDLAIASGVAAGEAAEAARAAGGMTAANLGAYEKVLRRRNGLTDLGRFRRAPLYMKKDRLFDVYPRMLMEIAERMYTVDGAGKERLFDIVLDEAASAGVPKLKMLLDLLQEPDRCDGRRDHGTTSADCRLHQTGAPRAGASSGPGHADAQEGRRAE